MMSYTLKKKLLPSVVAVALASGLAFSGSASAIHLSEEGIGQVLMGPMYLAQAGYRTKVALVNTREDVAVKAKVVLRSAITSAEVLDFICYLTPGDVCRFEIVNVGGQAYLQSDDDSVKSTATTFASQTPLTNPGQALYDQNLGTGDINEMGHIEIIGAYAVKGNLRVNVNKVVQVFQGMSKNDLKDIFDTARTSLINQNGGANGVGGTVAEIATTGRMVGGVCSGTPARDAGLPCNAAGDAPSGLIRSTDPDWVRLTADVQIVSDDSGDRLGYRMPALVGEIWDNVPVAANFAAGGALANGSAGFEGRVISNSTFDVQGGDGAAETAVGFGFGGVLAGFQVPDYDNIIEIEHALAVENFKGIFEDDANTTANPGINRTQLVITFPTKYRHTVDVCGSGGAAVGVTYFPPFQPTGILPYTLSAFDNQENNLRIRGGVFSGGPVAAADSLPAEVNYFFPVWPSSTNGVSSFESGWFDLALQPRAGCSYSGAPALAYAHKYQVGASSLENSWMTAIPHTPDVSNRDVAPIPPSGNK